MRAKFSSGVCISGHQIKLPRGNGPYCFWICGKIYLWSHHYIQTRQINQDMNKFIFLMLFMQQQNDLKANQTRAVWLK
jgi:hypothetical protein